MHLVKGYTGDSDVEKSEDHSTAHTEPRESLKNHIQVLFPWSSKPKSWYTTVVNSGMAITIDCGASQVALVVMTVPAGGDRGSIPRSGRSPREGNGDPLQYSSLGKPTDRGACGLWYDLYNLYTMAHSLYRLFVMSKKKKGRRGMEVYKEIHIYVCMYIYVCVCVCVCVCVYTYPKGTRMAILWDI